MIQIILGLAELALAVMANLYLPANLMLGFCYGAWLAEHNDAAWERREREEEDA